MNGVNGDGKCGDDLNWTLSDGILTIDGSGAMYDYDKYEAPWDVYQKDIKEVVIDEDVTSIGDFAFAHCSNLKGVEFSHTVERIGRQAFYRCKNLKSIFIPDSVTFIGRAPFGRCQKLASIEVEKNNSYYVSIDGVLFDHNVSTLLQYPDAKANESYPIPNTVTTIAAYAFASATKMKVIIPDSVKTIEEYAFQFCDDLTNVTIPDSVTSIGKGAFVNCSGLTSVFYQGTQAITTSGVFSDSPSLTTVCVPHNYQSPTFCGKTINSTLETCQVFQKMFNDCFKGACVDGKLVYEKRENATDWEKQTNSCVKYQCSTNGPVAWSLCNSSDDTTKMCLKDQCVTKQSSNNQVYVKAEMNYGVSVLDIKTDEILKSLKEQCQIQTDGITVGWETDKQGYVSYITFYLKDFETGKNIVSKVLDVCKGKGCGVLAQVKDIKVYNPEQSGVENIHVNMILTVLAMLFFVMAL